MVMENFTTQMGRGSSESSRTINLKAMGHCFLRTRLNITVFTANPGKFKEGKRHGKGHFKDVNGTYYEELWDMNQLVSKKEVKGDVRFDVLYS